MLSPVTSKVKLLLGFILYSWMINAIFLQSILTMQIGAKMLAQYYKLATKTHCLRHLKFRVLARVHICGYFFPRRRQRTRRLRSPI